MYKFDHSISKLDTVELSSEKLFLWIFTPNEKSPHIGISFKGSYYSLQLNGKQENFAVNKLVSTIARKNMGVLFVELKPGNVPVHLNEAFQKYSSCQKDACSCTAPLFDLFEIVKPQAILFDLLEKLKVEDRIVGVYQTNLSPDFEGIPLYVFADVQDNLLQLIH